MSEYIKRRRQIERVELVNTISKKEEDRSTQTDCGETLDELQSLIIQMKDVFGPNADAKIQEWINIGKFFWIQN